MKPKTSVLIVSPEKSRGKPVFPLPGTPATALCATISGEDDALRLVNTTHFDCVVIPDDGSAASSGLVRIIRIIRPDMPILQPGMGREPGELSGGREMPDPVRPGRAAPAGLPAPATDLAGYFQDRAPDQSPGQGRFPRLVRLPKAAAHS
jgi:hypothetical protein